MPFITAVNWLFNDMWCYLVIASFDWKIRVFQKTVVTVVIVINLPSKGLQRLIKRFSVTGNSQGHD